MQGPPLAIQGPRRKRSASAAGLSSDSNVHGKRHQRVQEPAPQPHSPATPARAARASSTSPSHHVALGQAGISGGPTGPSSAILDAYEVSPAIYLCIYTSQPWSTLDRHVRWIEHNRWLRASSTVQPVVLPEKRAPILIDIPSVCLVKVFGPFALHCLGPDAAMHHLQDPDLFVLVGIAACAQKWWKLSRSMQDGQPEQACLPQDHTQGLLLT